MSGPQQASGTAPVLREDSAMNRATAWRRPGGVPRMRAETKPMQESRA